MSSRAPVLPEESEGQRIGRMAGKCFVAKCPNDWAYQQTDGDTDYGFDYQIQVIVEGRVTDVFRAQLKGTTVPVLSADGTHIAVTLNASTVRYYARVDDPIMLVLCDLSSDRDNPARCPLYYEWIDEELRRINVEGIPDTQQTVTLRVPVAKTLAPQTDVTPYLKIFRDLRRASRALDVVVEEKYPGLPPQQRADLIARIPGAFQARSPALLEAMSQDVATAWPEAPSGSFPWLLQRAADYLRVGNDREAEAVLVDAEADLAKASAIEQAEYWLRVGKLRALRLDESGARDAFACAAERAEFRPPFSVAWAEAELRCRFRSDEKVFLSDVLARLSECSEPGCIAMRARLMAAEGRYEEALLEAQKTSSSDGWAAQAIIETMRGDAKRALAACESCLQDGELREATRTMVLVLRARAKFNLAIGKLSFDTAADTVIPPSGPASTDIELLRDAWRDITAVVSRLRTSGWPSNVEFVADMWCAAAAILGLQKDALPLVMEAAKARPTIAALQQALESIAAQTEEFNVALQANRMQRPSDAQVLRRITLLHMARRDAECVDLYAHVVDKVSVAEQLYGFAGAMAILSADRIVRPDLAEKWYGRLAAEPRMATELALLDYFRNVDSGPLAKDAALQRLEEQCEAQGRPLLLVAHLFHELDPTNQEQARKCVDLATSMQSTRMLAAEAAMQLALAFVTLGEWNRLLDLAREALLRFEQKERFRALVALALDRLGHASEAFNSLKELIEAGRADSVAFNVYINIVVRSGFHEEAMQAVERVLSVETRKERQIECLRLLFSLVHMADPLSPRCAEIAWRIGAIADRDEEAQEGLFLLTAVMGTLRAEDPIDEARKKEFQERLEAFSRKFPNSKMLKVGTFPSNASPDDLLKTLRQVVGFDAERERWREKTANQLRQGELPIPFAWRPRNVLEGVADVVSLWEIGKGSRPEERQYHLVMVAKEWKPLALSEMRGQVPLLDLVAILVLDDLGLWDGLFELFPKVAISQATLVELQKMCAPFSGSPYRTRCIEIQTNLKAKFRRIIQPRGDAVDDADVPGAMALTEEIKELVRQGRFVLYSDDVLFRIYCDTPAVGPRAMCSLDVLCALDELGALPPEAVAAQVAQLCRWNVGVAIPLRYQLAALPNDLMNARSVSEGIDRLHASGVANSIFTAIWDLSKPYMDLQGQGGALLRQLCDDPRNHVVSVAAVAGLWHVKVHLHSKSPETPLKGLVQLILQAAAYDPEITEESAKRLWAVFRALVEVLHGERMDESREKEAVRLMGSVAADVDLTRGGRSEKGLFHRLGQGLTSGTSESDLFSQGYTDRFTVRATKR